MDNEQGEHTGQGASSVGHRIDDMYKEWFLDYASYVILDRAVPAIEDGLKPVQRRLLYALAELEDGRFNKAANVIGHAMRYHPHGDMAIADALVKIGQKELLCDIQGNWGNPVTGDKAAASRYIEVRLSKLGRRVLFNDALTEWQPCYDGRSREPVFLPTKYPLVLATGTDGIAVGLSTKILPHNFCEILRESVSILRGRHPRLLPDFASGGSADFSNYNDGRRGGKVRVRAVLHAVDQRTIMISELPYGVTTQALIESILAANEKGKIKVKRVDDNTAQNVEILVHLPSSISATKTIEALYAFTDCEVSISVNCCVIKEGKPIFCGVSDVLRHSVERTKELLRRELEIARHNLRERIHFASLEKIFIEKKIYQKIEKAETWEAVLETIDKGLKRYSDTFLRPVVEKDLMRLTEIKIKRISKFNSDQAEEEMAKIGAHLAEVEGYLKDLTSYTISYFRDLMKEFGKGRERRTKEDTFSKVDAAVVADANQKLYVDRKNGFVGTGLKKDEAEFVCECSTLDEVIVFRRDGRFMVVRTTDKVFVGKDVISVHLFKRGDERMIYHMIYGDGSSGTTYGKRFNVVSVTRSKEYDLTKGSANSKVLYFSANPNGESEEVSILLKPRPRSRQQEVVVDFSSLLIKSRSAVGTIVARNPVKKIVQRVRGASTLAAQRVWYDRQEGRLNTEERGTYLGKFSGDERLVAVYDAGFCEIFDFALDAHLGSGLLELQKLEDEMVLSTVYYDGERDDVFAKRVVIQRDDLGRQDFINVSSGLKVFVATLANNPVVVAEFVRKKRIILDPLEIHLDKVTEIRGPKAVGNRLSQGKDAKIERVKLVR